MCAQLSPHGDAICDLEAVLTVLQTWKRRVEVTQITRRGPWAGKERGSEHRWSDLSLSSWYGTGFAELRFLNYFLMSPSRFEAALHHYNHHKQFYGPAFLLTPSNSQAWICSMTLPSLNRSSCGWKGWRKITLETDYCDFKYLMLSLRPLAATA